MGMMREQAALFEEWRKELPGMVTDGLADEEKYKSAPVRLCFLLKEANGGKDWDLCRFLAEGGRPQTWDNLSRWIYGIYHADKDISWNELEKIDADFRKKYLQTVCAVNVKKSSGSYEADSEKIKEAAKRDAELLRRQLNLYDPQILILCGTDSCYFDQITEDKNPEWTMTKHGIWYVTEPSGRIVISYSHPAARTKDCLLYYGLVDAYKEIRKAQRENPLAHPAIP